jgi:hypothetical protein
MKELIEQHQSAYYRSSSDRSGGPAAAPGGGIDPRLPADRRSEA